MILVAQAVGCSIRYANACTSLSPDFVFNPTISLGDIAQALSLPLSLLVAWLTIRSAAKVQQQSLDRTLAEQRTLTFLQDLLSRLGELLRDTNEVAKLVRRNYTRPDAKWKDHQATTDSLRKECGFKIDILRAFLKTSDSDQLDLAYNKWYDAIFCDAWPCKPRVGAMKAGDTRLKALDDGNVTWSQFILQMKRNMLKGFVDSK